NRSFHRSCTAPAGLLGWPPTTSQGNSQHAAPGRLLFFAAIAMGLYRAQGLSRSRGRARPQGQSQAGGAGRSVFGNRRIAADETPSGAAALPDGRAATLARQARPEI